MILVAEYNPRPIPIRCFDWVVIDYNYEPENIIGFGSTKEEAIQDFINQLLEKGDN